MNQVSRLLECLPTSNLPDDIQDWLREMFNTTKLLPDTSLDHRDRLIRLAIQLSPGTTNTARCCVFLDALSGQKRHPSRTVRELISKLHGTDVPQSIKQLTRILRDRRQDGWRTF